MEKIIMVLCLAGILFMAGCAGTGNQAQEVNAPAASNVNHNAGGAAAGGAVAAAETRPYSDSLLVSDLGNINLGAADVPSGAVLDEQQSGLVTNALQYSDGDKDNAASITDAGWLANGAVSYEVNDETGVATKTIWSGVSLYKKGSNTSCSLEEDRAYYVENDYAMLPSLEQHGMECVIASTTKPDSEFYSNTTYFAECVKYNVYLTVEIDGVGRTASQMELEKYLDLIEQRMDKLCKGICQETPKCTAETESVTGDIQEELASKIDSKIGSGAITASGLAKANLAAWDVPDDAVLDEQQSGLVTNALQYSDGDADNAAEITGAGWLANNAVAYEIRDESGVSTKEIWSALSVYKQGSNTSCALEEDRSYYPENNYTLLPLLENHGMDCLIASATVPDDKFYSNTTYIAECVKYNVFVNLEVDGVGRTANQLEVEHYLNKIEQNMDAICNGACQETPKCT